MRPVPSRPLHAETATQRQGVAEGTSLLAVEAAQLEVCLGARVLGLFARVSELLARGCGHGHIAREPERHVAVGQLALAPDHQFGLSAATCAREETAAPAELGVRQIGDPGLFDRPGRSARAQWLHDNRDGAAHGAEQQWREEVRRDVEARPFCDPVHAVPKSIGLDRAPFGSDRKWPRVADRVGAWRTSIGQLAIWRDQPRAQVSELAR